MKRESIAKVFGETWVDFMAPFVTTPAFDSILVKLREDKAAGVVIFPDPTLVFRAFLETPLPSVRVIIMGQDPYPIEGYANGLAFAHPMTKKIAPSLDKIIDAIEVDMYNGLNFAKAQFDTELKTYPEQGILLLNASLTVKTGVPGSYTELWKPFTDFVIAQLAIVRRDLIWMAWGKDAQTYTEKLHFVTNFILTAEHPAFAAREKRPWDCKHFSIANAIIVGNQLGERIKW